MRPLKNATDQPGPLRLEEHLRLREQMSTVQSSSYLDLYRASQPGQETRSIRQFQTAHTGTGKLSSGEFVQFGFCDGKASDEHIATFAGKQAQQAFNRIYNDWSWYAITKNKIAFETLMRGAGLPVPETVAVYDRKGRGAGARILRTTAELGEFLCNPANLPVFCKPTTGLMSIGSFRVDGAENGELFVNGRHRYSPDEVVRYVTGISNKGYLFQTVLHPHSAFLEIGCNAIASLRVLVLNFEEQAVIHSAVLKLPAPGEVADNFWREGSVIALVDLADGKIDRAVLKTLDKSRLLGADTQLGQELGNFALPDFSQALGTVLSAARFLPGVKVQSWDVAFTTTGPVLLEVNFGGDLNLYQLASGKGVMDKLFCEMLRSSGFKGRLPN